MGSGSRKQFANYQKQNGNFSIKYFIDTIFWKILKYDSIFQDLQQKFDVDLVAISELWFQIHLLFDALNADTMNFQLPN